MARAEAMMGLLSQKWNKLELRYLAAEGSMPC
jgi:hypothetical protein